MSQTPVEQTVMLLKGISHPICLRILLYLLKQPGLNASTLQNQLGISQAALAEHLVKLKTCQLVEGKREGRLIQYWLVYPALIRTIFGNLGQVVD